MAPQRWAYSFKAADSFRERQGNAARSTGPAPGLLTAAPEDDDPGEDIRVCSRGPWCAEGVKIRADDGAVTRQPAVTPRAFCETDRALIVAAIRDLPAVHSRLHAHIGVHVTGEVVVRAPFGPSVPLRLDVDEIMRLIVDAALTWHEVVAAVAGLSASGPWRRQSLGMRAGGLLPRPVRVLSGHLDTLLGLEPAEYCRPASSPAARVVYAADVIRETDGDLDVVADGGSAGNEFLRLDWLARAVLLETPAPAERLIGVLCRNCERPALRRAAPPQHDGDPEYYSACLICGDYLTPGEYGEWTARLAAFYRDRVTPAQTAFRPVVAGGGRA